MIRKAGKKDLDSIRQCAAAAYRKYVERIGREPAPMVADFAAAIEKGQVHVYIDQAEIAGFIVFYPRADHIHLENIAVHPTKQGHGIGRALVEFVETRATELGYARIELYTNTRMTENLALYPLLGYRQFDRRLEDGFERVYFRKSLAASVTDT
jgi:ribosomal protein S18 acetylase RimI-like enzyme